MNDIHHFPHHHHHHHNRVTWDQEHQEAPTTKYGIVALPAFRLTAAQEASGTLEVIVEAPSGKILKPDITSSDGLYNTTFMPEEQGTFIG